MTDEEARVITNEWEKQGYVYGGDISYSWMRGHTIPEDEVPEYPCPRCDNEDYTLLMWNRKHDTKGMYVCLACDNFYTEDEGE